MIGTILMGLGAYEAISSSFPEAKDDWFLPPQSRQRLGLLMIAAGVVVDTILLPKVVKHNDSDHIALDSERS